MSMLDRFLSVLGIMPKASTPLSSIVPGTDDYALFTGGGNGTGLAALNEGQALAISAVYGCVNLIAGAIAAMPMKIYRRRPHGEQEEIFDHPLWWMLNEEFHPRWAAHAGWEWLVASKLLHGDAFAIIQRRGPTVVGLKPVHPRNVDVLIDEEFDELVYRVNPWGYESRKVGIVVRQDDMLHIPSLGFDGRRSPSALKTYLSATGALAKAAQDFSGRFYANGARPDYALKTDNNMSQEQIESLRQQIADRHGGVENSRRPMLLTGGLGFDDAARRCRVACDTKVQRRGNLPGLWHAAIHGGTRSKDDAGRIRRGGNWVAFRALHAEPAP